MDCGCYSSPSTVELTKNRGASKTFPVHGAKRQFCKNLKVEYLDNLGLQL